MVTFQISNTNLWSLTSYGRVHIDGEISSFPILLPFLRVLQLTLKILNLDGVSKGMKIPCLWLLANRYWKRLTCACEFVQQQTVFSNLVELNYLQLYKSVQIQLTVNSLTEDLTWSLLFVLHSTRWLAFLASYHIYCPKTKDKYRVSKMNTDEWCWLFIMETWQNWKKSLSPIQSLVSALQDCLFVMTVIGTASDIIFVN